MICPFDGGRAIVRIPRRLSTENEFRFTPSPGTPGEGGGEGIYLEMRKKTLTLSLSRRTGRGEKEWNYGRVAGLGWPAGGSTSQWPLKSPPPLTCVASPGGVEYF